MRIPAARASGTLRDRGHDDVELLLAPGSDSPARAREFIADTLSGWGLPADVVDDAVLLTSELVGNAVRYCSGETTVRVKRIGDRIRVQVRDNESRAPVLHSELSLDAESGRGLQLVDVLAVSWGWQPVGPGKEVWFELAGS